MLDLLPPQRGLPYTQIHRCSWLLSPTQTRRKPRPNSIMTTPRPPSSHQPTTSAFLPSQSLRFEATRATTGWLSTELSDPLSNHHIGTSGRDRLHDNQKVPAKAISFAPSRLRSSRHSHHTSVTETGAKTKTRRRQAETASTVNPNRRSLPLALSQHAISLSRLPFLPLCSPISKSIH